ncbi:MAG: transketolase [bacterium]
MKKTIEKLSVEAIRILSIDMVQKARSGHPGLPMGAAPMAYTLWKKNLKYNPADPKWPDRDRFILSAGHGSALLYSMLFLTGYDLSLDDLKNFRQWGSKTPGHPEAHITPGVEATTGPLGQGSANAVGMAIAERFLAGYFNRPGFEIVDHFTYALVSDGDLMEGISAEAGSLAGHLGLGKLIYLYDSNDISLDGPTALSFTEDVGKRYEAYGWQILKVENGDEDLDSIDRAIKEAKAEKNKPSLIIIKTTIGFGCKTKQGTSSAHGSPLGDKEVASTKEFFGWDPNKFFDIPAEVISHMRDGVKRGKIEQEKWQSVFKKYCEEFPDLSDEWKKSQTGELPESWNVEIPNWEAGGRVATRIASGKILNAIGKNIPWLIGGDADLSCSTKTALENDGSFNGATGKGRNIRYGVREHSMAAIANGIAWHGGIRNYVSTFFVFSDYMKPSIRLAAMNRLPVIYIFTHDSLGVGEDGPTHQPVEHLSMLRSIPNLAVIRPCDANETVDAWKWAMNQIHRPVALVLSRQDLPIIERTEKNPASGLNNGAYIIHEPENGNPKAIIIASGSEVQIALQASEILASENISVRVVSMPCWEIFEEAGEEYRESVLPSKTKARVSIEAGTTFGWRKWIGDKGIAIGVDRFGSSAPGDTVLSEYGFTTENVVAAVKTLIDKPNE